MIEIINLRNCKDFGTRPGDVAVHRGTKWGNPFHISKTMTRDQACDAYEKWIIDQLAEEKLDIEEIAHARRLGCWCFGAGSLVTTKRGFVPIEEVTTEDFVLSHDSKYHRVTKTMKFENIPTIKVKFQGIPEPIVCTKDHEFYTRHRSRIQLKNDRKIRFHQPSWTPAREMHTRLNTSHSQGTWVGFPRDDFSFVDDHSCNFWYLVGRYLGDGWLGNYHIKSGYTKKDGTRSIKQQWMIGICSHHNEADTLEQMVIAAGFHPNRTPMKTQTTFRIFNKEFSIFLSQFGRYCHGKYIPEWCFSIQIEKQRSLLQGIVDSDGYSERRRKEMSTSVVTVSRVLAFGISRLARNVMNIRVSMCKKALNTSESVCPDGRIIRANFPVYQISWTSSKKCESICNDNCVWIPFRNASNNGNSTVYNLSVEDSESYVVCGIAVHNCSPARCHAESLRILINLSKKQVML